MAASPSQHLSEITDLCAMYPDSIRANWYWLITAMEAYTCGHHILVGSDYETVPRFVRHIVFICERAPHYLKRRIISQNVKFPYRLSWILQQFSSEAWAEEKNGNSMKKVLLEGISEAIAKKPRFEVWNLNYSSPVLSEILALLPPISKELSDKSWTSIYILRARIRWEDLSACLARAADSGVTRVAIHDYRGDLAAIPHLERMSSLEHLTVSRCKLEAEFFSSSFAQALQGRLKTLHLDGSFCRPSSLDSLILLLSTLTRLESLGLPCPCAADFVEEEPEDDAKRSTLAENVRIPLFFAAALVASNLVKLRFHNCSLDAAFFRDVAPIFGAAQNLEVLDLFGSEGLGSTHYDKMAAIAHRSLRAIVLPSGELLTFTGSTSATRVNVQHQLLAGRYVFSGRIKGEDGSNQRRVTALLQDDEYYSYTSSSDLLASSNGHEVVSLSWGGVAGIGMVVLPKAFHNIRGVRVEVVSQAHELRLGTAGAPLCSVFKTGSMIRFKLGAMPAPVMLAAAGQSKAWNLSASASQQFATVTPRGSDWDVSVPAQRCLTAVIGCVCLVLSASK